MNAAEVASAVCIFLFVFLFLLSGSILVFYAIKKGKSFFNRLRKVYRGKASPTEPEFLPPIPDSEAALLEKAILAVPYDQWVTMANAYDAFITHFPDRSFLHQLRIYSTEMGYRHILVCHTKAVHELYQSLLWNIAKRRIQMMVVARREAIGELRDMVTNVELPDSSVEDDACPKTAPFIS